MHVRDSHPTHDRKLVGCLYEFFEGRGVSTFRSDVLASIQVVFIAWYRR